MKKAAFMTTIILIIVNTVQSQDMFLSDKPDILSKNINNKSLYYKFEKLKTSDISKQNIFHKVYLNSVNTEYDFNYMHDYKIFYSISDKQSTLLPSRFNFHCNSILNFSSRSSHYQINTQCTNIKGDGDDICNMGLMFFGFPIISGILAFDSYDSFSAGDKKTGYGYLIASGVISTTYTIILIHCRKRNR